MIATLIAVYGLFMTPLGWGWALFVWGYALTWFLVNDRVKLLAYQLSIEPKLKQNLMPKLGLQKKLSQAQKPKRSLHLKPHPSI